MKLRRGIYTSLWVLVLAFLAGCSSDPARDAKTAHDVSVSACALYSRDVLAGKVKDSPELDRACAAVNGLCPAPSASASP